MPKQGSESSVAMVLLDSPDFRVKFVWTFVCWSLSCGYLDVLPRPHPTMQSRPHMPQRSTLRLLFGDDQVRPVAPHQHVYSGFELGTMPSRLATGQP